jgi:hypothetical protein
VLEAVIGTAVTREAFRLLLLAEPVASRMNYTLLDKWEQYAVQMIDAERLEACAEVLRPFTR